MNRNIEYIITRWLIPNDYPPHTNIMYRVGNIEIYVFDGVTVVYLMHNLKHPIYGQWSLKK